MRVEVDPIDAERRGEQNLGIEPRALDPMFGEMFLRPGENALDRPGLSVGIAQDDSPLSASAW
jgi:hypothetical protein